MISRKLYILIPALFVWLACKKSELTSYKQTDMIYVYKDFYNTNKDSVTYSFAIKANSLITDTIKVPLRIMGNARDKDRRVAIQTVADNTTATSQQYTILPTIVKAGSFTTDIQVLVNRTPDMKTREVRILLEIAASTDFLPGVPNTTATTSRAGGATQYLIKINDLLTKPSNWESLLSAYFGAYSQVKYKFIIDVTGRTEFPITGQDMVSPSQFLFYKKLCREALENYNTTNGPLTDEFGMIVTFPN
ncbi:DUF4843 domain-containing protein [Niastella sp. OAS944]|uniref:DUF4843 domain-containing protein n=1 Tax=Niastella sp. OAS944 TaxID=2664089 RepID=UPI0034905380|nr:hypothetical protein [Chitinophagaceae bacterium OAS944]